MLGWRPPGGRGHLLLFVVSVALLPVSAEGPRGPPGPRLKLSHTDLRNGSALFWKGGVSDALLLDEDGGWLLVGGKDHIYLLQPDSLEVAAATVSWPAPREHVERCRLAGKSPETDCANFVRLLQPFNKTHVYACGTGAFHPQCTYVHVSFNAQSQVEGSVPSAPENPSLLN